MGTPMDMTEGTYRYYSFTRIGAEYVMQSLLALTVNHRTSKGSDGQKDICIGILLLENRS
jgi:hypothetical protein